MRTLALIVSDDVLRYIPDALRAEMLRLVDRLAEPHDYDDSSWGMDIPGFSREFKARVIRITSDPGIECVLVHASMHMCLSSDDIMSFQDNPTTNSCREVRN